MLGVVQAQSLPMTIHVIQRDETLANIADQYLVSVDRLVELNSLRNEYDISIGQRILVPRVTEEAIAAAIENAIDLPPHVVQPGETLQSIANVYSVSLRNLIDWNDITNPDQVYVGQSLAVSAPIVVSTPTVASTQVSEQETTALPEPQPSLTPGSNPAAQIFHTISSGESLYQIAQQYGLTINDIATANNITDTTLIFEGQRILIPGYESPIAALDLPEMIETLQVNPLIFAEGETGSVQLQTEPLSEISGTFLERELAFASTNTTTHVTLIPIPVFTELGVYPLEISLTDENDETVEITLNMQIISGFYGTQNLTVDASLIVPGVEENELEILAGVTSNFTETRNWLGQFGLPAAAPVNGLFGTNRSYNGGPVDRFHTGLDFSGAPGTPVKAAAPGIVVLADTLNIRGTATVIDHGWGVYTLYAHQQERFVQLGDAVQAGEAIGTIGTSGRSTGPHLHWEVWVQGIPVNPSQWVQESIP